jgi:hypothetical protein
MTVLRQEQHGFPAALLAEGRSTDVPESDDLYGWLIGSWKLEVVRYRAIDVSDRGLQAEAHFARVLEGRAVQDVWIMPRTSARAERMDTTMSMYGTTLRVWDASIRAWRITWVNPVGGHVEQQIGRRAGGEIVQVGLRSNGAATRWRFTAITESSFRWLGESLQADGSSWLLEGEFLARRV